MQRELHFPSKERVRLLAHLKGENPQSHKTFTEPCPHALLSRYYLFRLINAHRLSSVYFHLHFPDAVEKFDEGPTASGCRAVDAHTHVLTHFTI